MPSASAIKAGETFVRMSLEAGEMEKGLAQIRNKLDRFARSAVKVGATLAAIGGAGVVALSKAAAAANRVELVGRRLDAVFRDAADEARGFARELAVSIGDSRFAVEDTLVTFKSFFAEIVKGEKDQISFSNNMTRLSRDFAAFQGMDTTEALQRFISALSGSPEVLDRFGINLKAAALDAEFMANGLDVTTENATEFQKVIARMAIIERTMSKQGAIGKAVQELTTFSGSLRAATSAIRDFTVAVGQALLPILKPVLVSFTGLARGLETIAMHAPVVTVAMAALAVGTAAVGASLIAAAAAATGLGLAIAVTSSAITGYTAYVKHANLHGAHFSAVVNHATNQLKGFAIGAASAGLSAIGLQTSTTAAAAAFARLQAAAAGAVTALSTFLPMLVLAGSAVGGGATAFLTMTAAMLVGIATLKLMRRALAKVGDAAEYASYQVALYNGSVNGMAAANAKASVWTTAFASQFGRLGKVAMVLGGAIKFVVAAVAGLTAAGLLAVGVIGTVIGFAAIVLHQFGLLKGIVTFVGNAFYTLWAVAVSAIKAIIGAIPGLGKAMEWLSDFVSNTIGLAMDGIEALKDAWADLMWILGMGPGSSEDLVTKQVKNQIAAADEVAKHIMDLDRRIEDARIGMIANRIMREKEANDAKFKREIDDIKAEKTAEINKARNEELQAAIDGGLYAKALQDESNRINEKYDQRIADIEKNNLAIQKIKEEWAISDEKIERDHAERMHDLNVRLESDLARSKIDAMKDGAAKELAQLRNKHLEEVRLTRLAGDERRKMLDRQKQDEANLIAKFNQEAADAVMAGEKAIEDARIAGIEDQDTRSRESLRLKHDRAMKELEDRLSELSAAKEIDDRVDLDNIKRRIELLRQEHGIEQDTLETAIAKRREEEAARAAKERASRIASLDDEIARMRIDLGGGTDLEKQLANLQLDRAAALKEAGGDLAEKLRILRLFNLKELAARQGADVKAAELSGGFGRRALAGIGPTQSMSKQEQLAKGANEKLDMQLAVQEKIFEMFRGAPFIGGLVP